MFATRYSGSHNMCHFGFCRGAPEGNQESQNSERPILSERGRCSRCVLGSVLRSVGGLLRQGGQFLDVNV